MQPRLCLPEDGTTELPSSPSLCWVGSWKCWMKTFSAALPGAVPVGLLGVIQAGGYWDGI